MFYVWFFCFLVIDFVKLFEFVSVDIRFLCGLLNFIGFILLVWVVLNIGIWFIVYLDNVVMVNDGFIFKLFGMIELLIICRFW